MSVPRWQSLLFGTQVRLAWLIGRVQPSVAQSNVQAAARAIWT